MFPMHDQCPGTSKYLEVHYRCLDNRNPSTHPKKLPPWLMPKSGDSRKRPAQRIPTDVAQPRSTRRPILVTDKTEEKTTTTTTTEMKELPVTVEKATDKVHHLNSERVPITTPSTVRTPHTATTRRMRTRRPPPSPRVTTGQPPSTGPSCPPTTSRDLQWDRTRRGSEAVQPCPIGAMGTAKWTCSEDGEWATSKPDMSHCKSMSMATLEKEVRAQQPETVLVSSLAYRTRDKALYGGDLASAVWVMNTVASRIKGRLQEDSVRSGSFHTTESDVRTVLQNVLRSASNLLEDSNRQAWVDLSSAEARKNVATDLLLALDTNAFLLARVMNEPDVFLESSDILSKSRPRPTNRPSS